MANLPPGTLKRDAAAASGASPSTTEPEGNDDEDR
jgi:hypothetical protein